MLIWFSNSYWSIAGALIQINPMQSDYCADRFGIDEISVMDMAPEPSFEPTTRAFFLQQQDAYYMFRSYNNCYYSSSEPVTDEEDEL